MRTERKKKRGRSKAMEGRKEAEWGKEGREIVMNLQRS